MSRIKLLPKAVANQIAAGEVIQRPSSALKETLENSIDSGAKNISVYIKKAGKTYLQIANILCNVNFLTPRGCKFTPSSVQRY